MRKYILLFVVLLCSAVCFGQSIVTEHRLSNGMKVWLNVDKTSPNVFGAVLVRAGAADTPGTGIAHYFEHMAFKGTDKIGTIDYAKEKVYQDSIEECYNRLMVIKSDKDAVAIQKQINRLSIEAAKYIIPNEFERLLQTYGGTEINAGTSYDYTVYYNAFSPKYINQWCALNSERLINPVFRLFQSELETVYEEKNMINNGMMGAVVDKALDIFFAPSPYAAPIIGYTANLKKPDMQAMRKYYEKFYNAANIDLLISGDIDSVAVLTQLENSFGRIRTGERVERNYPRAKEIVGCEKAELKISIPIVRGRLLGWRGATAQDSDLITLNVATSLLSNSNQTGYLDSLSISGKCLMAGVVSIPFRNEGVLMGILVPKILGGTLDGVEKSFFEQIDRIKIGDISDSELANAKLSAKRDYELLIEDRDKRVSQMISLLGDGLSWEQFVADVKRIESISKEDIMRVAIKYFSENYLSITKKTGSYPKEKIEKPEYVPITPHNQGCKSVFATELEKMELVAQAPVFLDLAQDAKSEDFATGVKLYVVENKDNDIFSLNYRFSIGSNEMPKLKQLESYMSFAGTDSLSYVEYMKRLQGLGAVMNVECGDDDFVIGVTGYDKNLDATVKLFSQYLSHIAVDDKAVKMIGEGNSVITEGITRDNNSVANALLKYAQYGDKSPYLTRLSNKEIGKLKAAELVSALDSLRSKEFCITYYGKSTMSSLKETLANAYDFDAIALQKQKNNYLDYKDAANAKIYYIKEPKSTQAIIYSYNIVEGVDTDAKMLKAQLIDSYIGGNMSSVLFQEIREFRSLAYNVNSNLSELGPKDYGRAMAFATCLSTQNDKATEAITLLDSLLSNVSIDSLRLAVAKREIVNGIYQSYPLNRAKVDYIAKLISEGYSVDPAEFDYKNVASISEEELNDFYYKSFRVKPTVYVIVGDLTKQQLSQIKNIGVIEKISKKDVIK